MIDDGQIPSKGHESSREIVADGSIKEKPKQTTLLMFPMLPAKKQSARTSDGGG